MYRMVRMAKPSSEMVDVGILPPSSRVLAKMMNGLPVRLKGGNLPLRVHHSRASKIAKAFQSGKGHQVSLTPEEVSMNGAGIFGKKFDRFLEKKGVKKLAYKVGDIAKPFAKRGIDALTTEAVLLQPELAPLAFGANYLAKDYLDAPSKYQGSGMKQRGRPRGSGTKLLDQKFSGRDAINFFKKDLPSAITGKGTKLLDQKFSGREAIQFFKKDLPDAVAGKGLYAGGGLYASGSSTGYGLRKAPSMKQTGLLKQIPQTLSAPNFENFQFSATLLPPYANIHR